jgi:hypothetical protein
MLDFLQYFLFLCDYLRQSFALLETRFFYQMCYVVRPLHFHSILFDLLSHLPRVLNQLIQLALILSEQGFAV